MSVVLEDGVPVPHGDAIADDAADSVGDATALYGAVSPLCVGASRVLLGPGITLGCVAADISANVGAVSSSLPHRSAKGIAVGGSLPIIISRPSGAVATPRFERLWRGPVDGVVSAWHRVVVSVIRDGTSVTHEVFVCDCGAVDGAIIMDDMNCFIISDNMS